MRIKRNVNPRLHDESNVPLSLSCSPSSTAASRFACVTEFCVRKFNAILLPLLLFCPCYFIYIPSTAVLAMKLRDTLLLSTFILKQLNIKSYILTWYDFISAHNHHINSLTHFLLRNVYIQPTHVPCTGYKSQLHFVFIHIDIRILILFIFYKPYRIKYVLYQPAQTIK